MTERQLDLLNFIDGYMRRRGGIAPSVREMAEALKLSSTSGVNRLIVALEERGYIHRLANRARAIEIIRMPA